MAKYVRNVSKSNVSTLRTFILRFFSAVSTHFFAKLCMKPEIICVFYNCLQLSNFIEYFQCN